MQNASSAAHIQNNDSRAPGARKRIGWVDGAKALAILAIMVGHFAAFSSIGDKASYVPWAHSLLEFCYSFHVPLFFILSGYCMKDAVMSPGKIANMFAKTFLPYLVTGIFIVIVGVNFSDHPDLTEWLAALAYGTGGYGIGDHLGAEPFGMVAIGVIWFLPALFVSKLIVTTTSPLPMAVRFPLMAACFFLGTWWANEFFLPMSFQEGIACSWYVFSGAALKKYDIVGRLTSYSKSVSTTQMISATVSHVYILGVGLWYMMLLTTETLAEPNYCMSWYHQPALDWVGTVAASLVVCFLAVRIEQICKRLGYAGGKVQSALELLGRSTLPVFCYHGVTIAWAANIIVLLGDIAEAGADPVMLFWAATLGDIAICCAAAGLSYIVPGLSYVYFPGSKNPILKFFAKKRGYVDNGLATMPARPDPETIARPQNPETDSFTAHEMGHWNSPASRYSPTIGDDDANLFPTRGEDYHHAFR